MQNARDGKRFGSLDGVRGIASLMVVFHHSELCISEPSSPVLWIAARFAVILFFVLSGFVLALPYFAGKNQRYIAYITRRFCRLYLPFAFAVLVAAGLCYLVSKGRILSKPLIDMHWSEPVTAAVIGWHLLMTDVRLNRAGWTLVVEMQVSLVFPFLVLWVTRFGLPGIMAAVVAAFFCSKLNAALGGEPTLGKGFAGTLLLTGRYMPYFLFGILAASRIEQLKAWLLRIPKAVHAAICMAAVSVQTGLFYMDLTAHGVDDLLNGLFSIYLIASCVTFRRPGVILQNRGYAWLGKVSFSLYLIHMPLLFAAFYLLYPRWPAWEIVVVTLPVVLIAADFMHRLIERPSMRLGRNLGRKLN